MLEIKFLATQLEVLAHFVFSIINIKPYIIIYFNLIDIKLCN
jgi:hypothetical protein